MIMTIVISASHKNPPRRGRGRIMSNYVWYCPELDEMFVLFYSEDKGPLIINPWGNRKYAYYIGEL
jgi:hypothetical protein